MDFNELLLNVKEWFKSLIEMKDAQIFFTEEIYREEKRFADVSVLKIEIEDKNNSVIILIYKDNYLYFDYLSKNDESMKSNNWSERYTDLQDIKLKILKSIEKYWEP
ncbi:hypothetical protein KRX57_07650 [Weeksellaceae bacterium TAE3-ERU29]|nr:hypothetical protein [Weeksellaceae bacterium TAE3-ERU29]